MIPTPQNPITDLFAKMLIQAQGEQFDPDMMDDIMRYEYGQQNPANIWATPPAPQQQPQPPAPSYYGPHRDRPGTSTLDSDTARMVGNIYSGLDRFQRMSAQGGMPDGDREKFAAMNQLANQMLSDIFRGSFVPEVHITRPTY